MTGVAIDVYTEWSVGRYVGAFNQVGVEVRCSTITLDWDVPLVVALARSERVGDPAVVVSAAAATDLATACRRALKELSANLAFVRNLLRGRPELPVTGSSSGAHAGGTCALVCESGHDSSSRSLVGS